LYAVHRRAYNSLFGGWTRQGASSERRARRRADRGCTPASTDTPTQRHFASFNSINLSKYVTQYNTTGRNLQNRHHSARSTMAPISRGGRPTLDDAAKKIAVSRTVSRSSLHIAIVSWRPCPALTTGEAGLLISIDRERCGRARVNEPTVAMVPYGIFIQPVYREADAGH